MEQSIFLLNLQMTGITASILEDRNEFKMILTRRSMIWKKGYCSIKVTAFRQESSGQYNIRNKKGITGDHSLSFYILSQSEFEPTMAWCGKCKYNKIHSVLVLHNRHYVSLGNIRSSCCQTHEVILCSAFLSPQIDYFFSLGHNVANKRYINQKAARMFYVWKTWGKLFEKYKCLA